MQTEFHSDEDTAFGRRVELLSKTGHYTFAIDRNVQVAMIANEKFNLKHLTKLQMQMVYPSASRLIDFIRSAGHGTKVIRQLVEEVSNNRVT